MTKREQIRQAKQQGYVTAQEAAELTGRKAGGNIHNLMVRYCVRYRRVGNAWMYHRPTVDKVPKLGGQTTAQAQDQFIDREVGKAGELPLFDAEGLVIGNHSGSKLCKQYKCSHKKPHKKRSLCKFAMGCDGCTCVPHIEKAEPVKSEAELLDGVKVEYLSTGLYLSGTKTPLIRVLEDGNYRAMFDAKLFIQLAREIVRRIDGETVKRTDVQPMIDKAVNQAVESFKEKIKGALL